MMGVIANKLLEFAKNTGSLVLVTIVSALFCNILLGDHCIAIAIPEGLVGLVYARSGMHAKKALPLPTRLVSLMPITAVKSWLHSITTEMKLLPLNRATALHSLY